MSTATRLRPSDTGACGTPPGYQRHARRGQDPCEPCRKAHNAARSERRVIKAEALRSGPFDKTGAKPLPEWVPFGRYAGRQVAHDFQRTRAGICLECWGWPDDPRHL